MAERPPIPADLRRQVLLEAGHRCAIHTCRHLDVDVHHIVPWAQKSEHRFENLIALCPNCHRRAEKGDIDRKSLRLYKARLAAAFRFQEVNLYPEETVLPAGFGWLDPAGAWTTRALTKQSASIEVAVEYPEFSQEAVGPSAAAVNERIRQYVEESMNASAQEFQNVEADDLGAGWYQQASFSVTLARPTLVSVRFAFSSYTGGAHGNHWTESLNIQTGPIRDLRITDLFVDPVAGVRRVSEYAVRELLLPRDGQTRDEDWVRRGAGPETENFKSFNLTSRGLLLTFDEYQVGCYADGQSEVHVPFDVMREQMEPRLAAELLWHDA